MAKKIKYKTERLEIRMSADELKLLHTLQDKRKKVGSARWSRASVIVDALKFANGEIIF